MNCFSSSPEPVHTQICFNESKRRNLNKLVLLLGIIDQFSSDDSSVPSVTLGLADGKYHIPENINEYDKEIAEMFGVTL